MSTQQISGGLVHEMPKDLELVLRKNAAAQATWESISVKARNEWICWIITVKQQKTRNEHLKRAISELAESKRRPCCWMGCVHRTDKAISPSQKFILEKQSRAN